MVRGIVARARRQEVGSSASAAEDISSGVQPTSVTPPLQGEERRLLLLTHYFPPSTQVGALRWRKMLSHLAEMGWGADVVAADAGSGPGLAEFPDLPNGLRIWTVPTPDLRVRVVERGLYRAFQRLKPGARRTGAPSAGPPTRAVRAEARTRDGVRWNLHSLRGYTRLWFTLRDFLVAREWTKAVVRVADRIARPGLHDVVISSGPPHHWHTAAKKVAARHALPLVLDLRDPWAASDIVHDYFATPLWLKLTEHSERSATRRADLLVANTPALHRAMARTYPDVAERIVTVMNGYDEDSVPRPRRSSCFNIGYAGSIYFGRDPRPLFEGSAAVIRELRLSTEDLKIRFIGDQSYGSVPLRDLAEEAGIPEYVDTGPSVPQPEAWQFMADSHMLVSLPWNDGLTVPAKVYEYMRFPSWLLVFSHPDSAVAELLRGMDTDVIRPSDGAEGVAAAIRRRYLQHVSGAEPRPLASKERYSRRAQTRQLHEALLRVIRSRADVAGSSRESES
jgi:glycosyltransferase involved in cell wall biosynthesis